MALYGNDIDDTITPLEAGLGWLVKLEKGRVRRATTRCAPRNSGASRRKLVGFELEGAAFPATATRCSTTGSRADVVRSGTMSPIARHRRSARRYLPAAAAKAGTTVRGRDPRQASPGDGGEAAVLQAGTVRK